MSERRDQMITYSRFDKLMRDEMPQGQGDLDAIQEGECHQQPRKQLGLRETGHERETE